MSIASEITRIAEGKAALKNSIEHKGVTVPEENRINEYPQSVDLISVLKPNFYNVTLNASGYVQTYSETLDFDTVKNHLNDPTQTDILDVLWEHTEGSNTYTRFFAPIIGITNSESRYLVFGSFVFHNNEQRYVVFVLDKLNDTQTLFSVPMGTWELQSNKVQSIIASPSQSTYPSTFAVNNEFKRKPDTLYTYDAQNIISGQSGNIFDNPVWHDLTGLDLSPYKRLRIFLNPSKHSVGVSRDNITVAAVVDVILREESKTADISYYSGGTVASCVNNDNRTYAITVLINKTIQDVWQIALKTVSLYGTSSTDISDNHIYLIEGHYE